MGCSERGSNKYRKIKVAGLELRDQNVLLGLMEVSMERRGDFNKMVANKMTSVS